VPPCGPQERGFVDPDRGHISEALRVVDQRFPAAGDLRHDRVPGHPELGRYRRNGPVMKTNLLESPLPGSFGEHRPGRDRVVVFGPGLPLAQRVSAFEDPFTPPDNHRGTAGREIPNGHRPPIFHAGYRTTFRATHQIPRGLYPQRQLAVAISVSSTLNPGSTNTAVMSSITWGSLHLCPLGGEHGS
jgi:hypothetical protein